MTLHMICFESALILEPCFLFEATAGKCFFGKARLFAFLKCPSLEVLTPKSLLLTPARLQPNFGQRMFETVFKSLSWKYQMTHYWFTRFNYRFKHSLTFLLFFWWHFSPNLVSKVSLQLEQVRSTDPTPIRFLTMMKN